MSDFHPWSKAFWSIGWEWKSIGNERHSLIAAHPDLFSSRTNPSLKPEKQFYAKPIKKHRHVTAEFSAEWNFGSLSSSLLQVNSRLTKVPKIPVDQLISGAVKQYLEYVKEDSDEQSQRGLFTSSSDRNSSTDGERYNTIDSTLNDTTRNSLCSSSLAFWGRCVLLEDERKNTSDSITVEPSPNRQTENIFMTEVSRLDARFKALVWLFSSKTMRRTRRMSFLNHEKTRRSPVLWCNQCSYRTINSKASSYSSISRMKRISLFLTVREQRRDRSLYLMSVRRCDPLCSRLETNSAQSTSHSTRQCARHSSTAYLCTQENGKWKNLFQSVDVDPATRRSLPVNTLLVPWQINTRGRILSETNDRQSETDWQIYQAARHNCSGEYKNAF